MLGLAGMKKAAGSGPNNNEYSNAILFGDFRGATGSPLNFIFQIGNELISGRHASSVFNAYGWSVTSAVEGYYGIFTASSLQNYLAASGAIVVEFLVRKGSTTYYPGCGIGCVTAGNLSSYLSNLTLVRVDNAITIDTGGSDVSWRPTFGSVNNSGYLRLRWRLTPNTLIECGASTQTGSFVTSVYGTPTNLSYPATYAANYIRNSTQGILMFGIWKGENYPTDGLKTFY